MNWIAGQRDQLPPPWNGLFPWLVRKEEGDDVESESSSDSRDAGFVTIKRGVRYAYLDYFRIIGVLGVVWAHAIDFSNLSNDQIRLNQSLLVGTQWGMAGLFYVSGTGLRLASASFFKFISRMCILGVLCIFSNIVNIIFTGLPWDSRNVIFHSWYVGFLVIFSIGIWPLKMKSYRGWWAVIFAVLPPFTCMIIAILNGEYIQPWYGFYSIVYVPIGVYIACIGVALSYRFPILRPYRFYIVAIGDMVGFLPNATPYFTVMIRFFLHFLLGFVSDEVAHIDLLKGFIPIFSLVLLYATPIPMPGVSYPRYPEIEDSYERLVYYFATDIHLFTFLMIGTSLGDKITIHLSLRRGCLFAYAFHPIVLGLFKSVFSIYADPDYYRDKFNYLPPFEWWTVLIWALLMGKYFPICLSIVIRSFKKIKRERREKKLSKLENSEEWPSGGISLGEVINAEEPDESNSGDNSGTTGSKEGEVKVPVTEVEVSI